MGLQIRKKTLGAYLRDESRRFGTGPEYFLAIRLFSTTESRMQQSSLIKKQDNDEEEAEAG